MALEKTVSVLADVSELSTAKQRWRMLSAYYGQVLINGCVIKMEIESCTALAGCEEAHWGTASPHALVAGTRLNICSQLSEPESIRWSSSPLYSSIAGFETCRHQRSKVLPATRGLPHGFRSDNSVTLVKWPDSSANSGDPTSDITWGT